MPPELVRNLIFGARCLFVLAYIQAKSINIHCLPFFLKGTEIIEPHEMTHSLDFVGKGGNELFDEVESNLKSDSKYRDFFFIVD